MILETTRRESGMDGRTGLRCVGVDNALMPTVSDGRNYEGPARPSSVCTLHAEEIVISSHGKRVTLGGARSAPSIDRAHKRQTSDILR